MAWHVTEDGPKNPIWLDDPEDIQNVISYCLGCAEERIVKEMALAEVARLKKRNQELEDLVLNLHTSMEQIEDDALNRLKDLRSERMADDPY